MKRIHMKTWERRKWERFWVYCKNCVGNWIRRQPWCKKKKKRIWKAGFWHSRFLHPTSELLGLNSSSALDPCWWVASMAPRDGSSTWVLVAHMGQVHWTASSHLQAGSSLAVGNNWKMARKGKFLSPPPLCMYVSCVFHINKNTKIHELERSSKTLWKCILQNHYA